MSCPYAAKLCKMFLICCSPNSVHSGKFNISNCPALFLPGFTCALCMPAASVASNDCPPALPPGVELKEGYVSVKCQFCARWSSMICPWKLSGNDCAKWHPFLPWGDGNRDAPAGLTCRICLTDTQLCICGALFFYVSFVARSTCFVLRSSFVLVTLFFYPGSFCWWVAS